jgi:hypothetical protein
MKRPALVATIGKGARGRAAIGDALLEDIGIVDGDPTHAELYSCRDVLAANGYEITANELAYMYVEALARR